MPGLVLYLPLNEGAGNEVYDQLSYAGQRRYNVSGPTWTHRVSRGKSLNWSGATSDKIVIGKPSCLNLSATSMSVCCWMFMPSVGQYRYPLSDYNAAASNAQFALQFTNTNKFTFFWANAGTQYPNPFTAASVTSGVANTWYFICGVRRGSAGNWYSDIYVNGKLENSTPSSGSPATQANAGNVTIGQPGDFVNSILPMVGSLQHVMIFNREITATEVREIMTKTINQVF